MSAYNAPCELEEQSVPSAFTASVEDKVTNANIGGVIVAVAHTWACVRRVEKIDFGQRLTRRSVDKELHPSIRTRKLAPDEWLMGFATRVHLERVTFS